MSLDPNNMRDVIEKTYEQFEISVTEGKNFQLNYSGLNKALVCGMGGSAFPGDLIYDYLGGEFDIKVNREYSIPSYVTKDTLIIISSYSGNTEETLSLLEDSLNKGLKTVVITAGGKLLDEANEKNIPVFKIPGGMQPRAATGHFFTGMMIILEKAGLIKPESDKFVELAKKLKDLNLETKGHEMAHVVQQRLAIIYSSNKFGSIAKIWKIKFNENAKQQAFFYEFPEVNHNELIGWTKLVSTPHVFLIKNKNDHTRVQKRMMITKEILEEKDIPVTEVEMKGETLFEQMFSTIMLGDFVSYHTAILNGVDPYPVPLVEEFKQRLNK